MKIKIGNADTRPSSEQISTLEASLGTRFTSEYLSFLAEHNGAVPDANIFRISDRNSSGVSRFIPVEKIAYEANLLDGEVSSAFFPIAYAEGGNYVCLPLNSSQDGVYFLDHEIPGLASLTRLAGSLRDFLEQLQPIDRAEVRLKPGQVKKAWIDPNFLK